MALIRKAIMVKIIKLEQKAMVILWWWSLARWVMVRWARAMVGAADFIGFETEAEADCSAIFGLSCRILAKTRLCWATLMHKE